MLTESLVLSLLGGAAGLVVAQWGGIAIRRMLVNMKDASLDTFTDWRTLGAVTVMAMTAAVLSGMAPALLAGRGDVATTLRAGRREGGGGASHRSRVRSFLLVAQGALSVALLIGAALFVRSLRHVKDFRLGYDADPVLLVSYNLRGLSLDSARMAILSRDLLVTARAIPRVVSAARASSVPFWSTSSTFLSVPGMDSVRRLGRFTYQEATPDFFRTIGTRILRGRGFTAADRYGAPPVAVVSQSMASVLWPGRDAIGQCMHVRKKDGPCTTVVGVAEDIVQQQLQLTDAKRYQYYLSTEQWTPNHWEYLLVRVSGDPKMQMESVRKTLQTVMPPPSYVTITPMNEIVDGAQRAWKLGANLFVAFGALALVVAAVGLYGVLAYNVTQRMHELGVRVALGAQHRDILRLVAGQGARFAMAGVVVGSALAYGASRWVEPLLFEQSATDPLVYGGVAVLMIVVALVASAAPARRATAADPNAALRSE
jgi:predicted permease